MDSWMVDTLKLVLSNKVTDELKIYQSTIDSPQEQASALGKKDREPSPAVERLSSIDGRYKKLSEIAKIRKPRLFDTLSLCKLFIEADGVKQYLTKKEKMLRKMVPDKDTEDSEIMKHKISGFDREMNANASRVGIVSQLARHSLHVDYPG